MTPDRLTPLPESNSAAPRWFEHSYPLRFDTRTLDRDKAGAVEDWVRSLGVNPNGVLTVGAVSMDDGGYHLHLSRVIGDEDGRPILDRARNAVVAEPLVIDLGQEPTWPAWLGYADGDPS